MLIDLILIFTMAASALYAQVSCSASSPASDIVVIEGDVKTTTHESGKTFVPTHQTLYFQREDCKKCILVVHTEKDGHYKVHAMAGKYRLIVNEQILGGSYLDPKQPAIIDARDKVRHHVFNVALIRHKTPFDDFPLVSPSPEK